MTESEIRAAFTPDYEDFVTNLTIMENPPHVWNVDAKVWDDGNRHAPVANYTRRIDIPPRRPPKVYRLWPLESVPGIGGHLKVYHPL